MTDAARRSIHSDGAARLPWRSIVAWSTAAALAACAASILGHTLWIVVVRHDPLPFSDAWALWTSLSRFDAGTASPWSLLAESHNEHRIAITRLAFMVDVALHANDRFLQALAGLAQVATTASIVALASRGRPMSWLHVCGIATIVALMATMRQGDNLTSGFQMQFPLCFTMPAIAVWAWTSDRPLAHRLAIAAPLALVAPFTMANGVLAGLAILSTSLLGRFPRRDLMVAVALAIVSIGAPFALGYAPHAHIGPLPDLWSIGAYASSYLGGMASSGRTSWSIAAGLAAIVAAAAAARPLKHIDRHAAALLSLAGFVAATAALTAIGRLGEGWPIAQSLSGRYATGSAVFCACAIALWCRRPTADPRVSAALFAAMMILALRDQHSYDRTVAARTAAATQALAASCGGEMLPASAYTSLGTDEATFRSAIATMARWGEKPCR